LPHVKIQCIIEPTYQPTSTIVKDLMNVDQLSIQYNCPVFETIDEFLQQSDLLNTTDGVIICTPHASHATIGLKCIKAQMNILMEKPMTTDVDEARLLYEASIKNPTKMFQINNSANWRPKAKLLYDMVKRGDIGDIRHVHAYFGVNLGWLFEDPAAVGWHAKSGSMSGNGTTATTTITAAAATTATATTTTTTTTTANITNTPTTRFLLGTVKPYTCFCFENNWFNSFKSFCFHWQFRNNWG